MQTSARFGAVFGSPCHAVGFTRGGARTLEDLAGGGVWELLPAGLRCFRFRPLSVTTKGTE